MITTKTIRQDGNFGYFVTQFEPLFAQFSAEPYPSVVYNVDTFLQPYVSNLYKKIEQELPVFAERDDISTMFGAIGIPTFNFDYSSKKMVIGFSGGKDGLAVAILAQKLGFDPILYHLYGINRTFKFERKNAAVLAKKLGMEYVEEEIQIKGKQEYPDHPFKNQMIMAHMVDFGLTRGVSNYMMGNHRFENCAGANVKLEFSDSGEQIGLFDAYLRNYIPSYWRETWLNNNENAIKVVADCDAGLLPLFSSCVMPVYRKPMLVKHIEKKFGKEVLLDGRCGYCYKCTKEYMLLADWGVLPMDKAFYARCKEIATTKNPVHYE